MNKILAEFAKTANDNLRDSQKDILVLSREKWAESMLKEYADYIEEQLVADSKYKIGDSVAYIFEVEEDAFRYKGDNWEKHERGLRMKFRQLLDVYLKGAESRKDIKKIPNIKGLVNEHATYYSKVLQDFRKFLTNKPSYLSGAVNISRKNYVLIIDEINRANLSSVLGELIYALEYRDKPVESIYEVDGERELVLPSNLYIIGTMNTADRSVGHIDYAIRRRFGFVTIPADESVVISNGSVEALNLFRKVNSLFYSTKDEQGNAKPSFLSSEFQAEDVMLGHSYFLEKNSDRLRLRFEYEITPILKEYIKDGILSNSALKEIETW